MRIGVVLHIGKPSAIELAEQLANWLLERGAEPVVLEEQAGAIGRPELAGAITGTELVVSLGGDGTLLRAAREVLSDGVPVLGINLGRLGFLSEVDADAVWSAMERVLAGEYRTEDRSVLECRTYDDNSRLVGQYEAINEVVIGGGARTRLIPLGVAINGEEFNRYYCDGMIFATPTGSMAYSLSAGGPLVSPDTRLVIMTPICPHSLLSRSIILSETDEISVAIPAERPDDVFIHTDGAQTEPVPGGVRRAVVTCSPAKFHLVRIEEHDFYVMLRRKLAMWDAMGEAQ